VSFDETRFPFADPSRKIRANDFEFLDSVSTNVSVPIGPTRSSLSAGLLGATTAQPRAAHDSSVSGGASVPPSLIGPPPGFPPLPTGARLGATSHRAMAPVAPSSTTHCSQPHAAASPSPASSPEPAAQTVPTATPPRSAASVPQTTPSPALPHAPPTSPQLTAARRQMPVAPLPHFYTRRQHPPAGLPPYPRAPCLFLR
jgi:hypothetical protein